MFLHRLKKKEKKKNTTNQELAKVLLRHDSVTRRAGPERLIPLSNLDADAWFRSVENNACYKTRDTDMKTQHTKYR